MSLSGSRTNLQSLIDFLIHLKVSCRMQACTGDIGTYDLYIYIFQAKQYGTCVSSRVPEVERDMCSKEFIVLKNCMQNVVWQV